MRLIIISLLFLFYHNNISALERNRDEALDAKAREMMEQINRIMRDLYNFAKDTHNPCNGEAEKRYSEIKPKSYHEQSKVPVRSHSFEQHGESMRLFYDLQARRADLQKRSEKLKRLREEWMQHNYDQSAYQRYAMEQEEYNKLFALYKQDLERHEKMKGMLRAR